MRQAMRQEPVKPQHDWRAELRRRGEEIGQRRLAALVGYSASTLNQVLAGTYKGDVKAVQRAVEGALMRGAVFCPALAQEIGTNDCLKFQRLPLAATSPARVKLHKTCPTCPHNRQQQEARSAPGSRAGAGSGATGKQTRNKQE